MADLDSPNEVSVDASYSFDKKDDGTPTAAPITSVPSHSTDPFAKREGKTLFWKDINMTLAANGDEPEKKLLQDVWGEVPQHNTTAIMGYVCRSQA